MRQVIHSIIFSLLAGALPVCAMQPTPVVGLPCEGCEAALEGLPQQLPSVARLAPEDEPGAPLRLAGTVRDAQGEPRAGVIVYAYQTDDRGIYPVSTAPISDEARRHGRLRAWAATQTDGHYAFLTIRPAGYPDSDLPQHIHLHVIEPGCATYYIDDVMFSDDPRLTPRHLRDTDVGRGGSGIVTPVLQGDVWQATRDIVLGLNIPGYPGCAPPPDSDVAGNVVQ